MTSMNGCYGFEKYEEGANEAWIYKISSSYFKIKCEVKSYIEKDIEEPRFRINPNNNTVWGSWEPYERIMTFSAKLLKNYEWKAVEHVMRHEIAHQIVSEIFDMDCYGVSHGEAFKRACKLVNIEPERCTSISFLSKFKGTESSPMISKIRKILIHANDKATTEEEADTFMTKAKELMLRHDIEMSDVLGKDRLFVKRPFGPLFKRWASYMWDVGELLEEHYDVKHLQSYGPNRTTRLELFGEPDKLDIAEYVGMALLNQAELLYEEHKAEVANKRKEAKRRGEYYYKGSKLSKPAFIKGVIQGYSGKLRKDKDKAIDRVEVSVAKERAESKGQKYNAGDRAIVPSYDKKLLKEMYNKSYNGLRSVSTGSCYGEGRSAGRAKGVNLTLSKGIYSSGNRGNLIGV